EAMVWLGRPADTQLHASLRDRMSAAISAEYGAVATEAAAARDSEPATRRRIVARLRRELHRIDARDFFAPPERDTARQAVQALTTETPDGAMGSRNGPGARDSGARR